MQKTTRFYCGTSNVELPVPNKSFYPEEYKDKSRLHYYALFFNSVEINSTFYKLPMPRTVERWAADVPADFRFTFKLWREISHAKELVYDPNNMGRFLSVIQAAGDKKGSLLVQFPASIRFSYFQKVKKLLDDLTASGMLKAWHLAIEFRDRSWYNDRVYEMLEHYNASIVIHDMPRSATPVIDMERSFVYLRFHGEQGDYRGSYDNNVLHGYAENIREWLAEGLPVYAYFNNTMGGAVQNAMTLTTYIRG